MARSFLESRTGLSGSALQQALAGGLTIQMRTRVLRRESETVKFDGVDHLIVYFVFFDPRKPGSQLHPTNLGPTADRLEK